MPLDEVIREGLRPAPDHADLSGEMTAILARADRLRSRHRRRVAIVGVAAMAVAVATTAVVVTSQEDEGEVATAPTTGLPSPPSTVEGAGPATPFPSTTVPSTPPPSPPSPSPTTIAFTLHNGITLAVASESPIGTVSLEGITEPDAQSAGVELHMRVNPDMQGTLEVEVLSPVLTEHGEYIADGCPPGAACAGVGAIAPGDGFTLPLHLLTAELAPGTYRGGLDLYAEPSVSGTPTTMAPARLWTATLVVTVPEPSQASETPTYFFKSVAVDGSTVGVESFVDAAGLLDVYGFGAAGPGFVSMDISFIVPADAAGPVEVGAIEAEPIEIGGVALTVFDPCDPTTECSPARDTVSPGQDVARTLYLSIDDLGPGVYRSRATLRDWSGTVLFTANLVVEIL